MVVYWPRSFRREGLVEGRVRIQMNHHVAGSSREEPCVIRRVDGHSRWRARDLVVVATSVFLLMASGCTKQDPYAPPDLFYYFASYKVGKNPTTVTPVDVNQDGFTDLVTTNIGSNTLSILLGNGDGTFRDQIQLNVCKEPRSLALGMFNRDPYPDVVLACSGGDEVAVLFGREDGKFEEGPRYPVHRTPIAIASDDLNGDQTPDLVVALRNDKIKVFLGTGTGEFTHGAQYEYGDTPTSVAMADLDGDGKDRFGRDERGTDVERGLHLDGEWRRHVSPSHRLSDGEAATWGEFHRLQSRPDPRSTCDQRDAG